MVTLLTKLSGKLAGMGLLQYADKVTHIYAAEDSPDVNIKFKKPKLLYGMKYWIAKKKLRLHLPSKKNNSEQERFRMTRHYREHVWPRVMALWRDSGMNGRVMLMKEFSEERGMPFDISEYLNLRVKPVVDVVEDKEPVVQEEASVFRGRGEQLGLFSR